MIQTANNTGKQNKTSNAQETKTPGYQMQNRRREQNQKNEKEAEITHLQHKHLIILVI
jgi:hypothetical protein